MCAFITLDLSYLYYMRIWTVMFCLFNDETDTHMVVTFRSSSAAVIRYSEPDTE